MSNAQATQLVYEIPLSPTPQRFNINIFGVLYIFEFIYRDVNLYIPQSSNQLPTYIASPEVIAQVENLIGPLTVLPSGMLEVMPAGSVTVSNPAPPQEVIFSGWCMDIFTAAGVPILSSIPLVTGIDLLGQHPYLQLGFALFMCTDENPFARPKFNNLGKTAHLYLLVT